MTPHVELLVEAVAVVDREVVPHACAAIADGDIHDRRSRLAGACLDGPLNLARPQRRSRCPREKGGVRR
jgi:hypothetical protein